MDRESERVGLQEIIDKAIDEMACEAGDSFKLDHLNLAEFSRRMEPIPGMRSTCGRTRCSWCRANGTHTRYRFHLLQCCWVDQSLEKGILMSPGRIVSESGYYHVVQKGAGDQIIFESDPDRIAYVRMLEEYLGEYNCALYAWCLMSNHTHLLLRSDIDNISKLMHDLGLRYAKRFNSMQGHNGPVFRGRYYSEPILSDRHFLAAIRYIHNNPEKARICAADKYKWSNYWEYTRKRRITNTDLALSMLGGVGRFIEFSKLEDTFKSTISEDAQTFLTDDAALVLAKSIAQPLSVRAIKALNPQQRRSMLLQFKEAGIRVTQAARLTGLGKATISRIYNGK